MGKITLLENNFAGPNVNSANTASHDYKAGRLYIVFIESKRGSAPDPATPSLTTAGLTWDSIRSDLYAPTQRLRLTSFRCQPTTDVSGAIAITFGGAVQDRVGWGILEIVPNARDATNGSAAIVQTAIASQNSASTGITVNLADFKSGNNMTLGCSIALGGSASPGSGFTELVQFSDSEVITEIMWKKSPDKTVDWTWGLSTFPILAQAIEIKMAPTGGGLVGVM
jgi:hypothetical protein